MSTDFLRDEALHKARVEARRLQVTTWWGFVRWRQRQDRHANMGTAIMSRRFTAVPPDRLRHWFDLYERRLHARLCGARYGLRRCEGDCQ